MHNVLLDLEEISDILFKWFTENHLKANPEKYHVLLSTIKKLSLKIRDLSISNCRSEKLLGIKIDHDLSFELHIESLCKKQVCITCCFIFKI